MDYYDLIKTYGAGKGEKVMWMATKRISDFIEPMKEANKEAYWKMIKSTYADMCGPHYNEEFAMWEIEQMYFKDKDVDGASNESAAFYAYNAKRGWDCLPDWKLAADLWVARIECPRV